MNIKYFCFLVWISICISSCKKFVDVAPPVNKLVTTSVFDNDATAISAQLAIYAQMQIVPYDFEDWTGLSGDEFTNYSSTQTIKDLYKNSLTAVSDGSNLIWPLAYKIIYQENAIIENVGNSSSISNNVKGLLIGEADFVRAYFYFYLVNLYGDVPLILTTDYTENSKMSRTPASKVYQQIIKDLETAKNSLSNNYLDATDTVVTSDRIRPTSWAALALLARTFLYNGQYDSAEAESSSIIANTNLFGLPGLSNVFLKNSLEAIWQLQPASSNLFTQEGSSFILTTPPGGSNTNCCSISPELLVAFEPGDNRRSNWIDSLKNGTNLWYYPYKYKDNKYTATKLREYSMVLRVGEQYLIRAEARAQQNNLSGAISDVNAIRARAGLVGLPDSLNQLQIISAIAHERQVELFSEGQRWLDLKRTHIVDSVMNNVSLQKGSSWTSTQQMYPLPVGDIQNGINLVQNNGY